MLQDYCHLYLHMLQALNTFFAAKHCMALCHYIASSENGGHDIAVCGYPCFAVGAHSMQLSSQCGPTCVQSCLRPTLYPSRLKMCFDLS